MSDINLRDIIGKPILKQELLSSHCCLIPLFHGTDRAVLKMSQEERNKLREDCGVVIDYLLPIYDANGFEKRNSEQNKNELGEIRAKVLTAHNKADLRRSQNAKYSYDNVYLSFSPIKAEMAYAANAWVCGELGYIAYWLLRGAKMLNYSLPIPTESVIEAINNVEKAASRKPDPVLLMYTGIEKSRLLTEAGCEINWEVQIDRFLINLHVGEVRVLGEFDIARGIQTSLKELRELSSRF